MKVLYVEDVPAQAEIVQTFLELAEGEHDMEHVETLRETRSRLKKEEFEVILLDLGLPDGEGTDLVTQVDKVAPDTPIVVLTGNEDPGLGIACLQAGAQDFLNKRDLTPQKLVESLTYAMTRKLEAAPELDRVLSRVKALHSSQFGEIDSKLSSRYQELLTQPSLLFSVEHWTLGRALAREGVSSEQVLAMHAESLSKVCEEVTSREKGRYLNNSELVALATIAFMSDTYRDLNITAKSKGMAARAKKSRATKSTSKAKPEKAKETKKLSKKPKKLKITKKASKKKKT